MIQQDLTTFLEQYPVRSFQKGEIVIFQGEAPRYGFAVKRGVVKAYNISVNGDEKPTNFYTEHSVFPVPWVYHKAPNAYYYFEAFTPVELYCVPRDEYLEFLRDHPDLMYQMLEKLVTEQIGTTMRMNALQHSRASDKLLYTLHYLTLTQGRQIADGVVEITLNLTHQDFANLTGLTRETTATELNKLKGRGVITYGKHTLYQVKVDKLNSVINDQFIADIQIE